MTPDEHLNPVGDQVVPPLPDDEPTRLVVHRLRAFWRGVGKYRLGAFYDFVEQVALSGELTDELPDEHPVNRAAFAAGRLVIRKVYGGDTMFPMPDPKGRGFLFALMVASMPTDVISPPTERGSAASKPSAFTAEAAFQKWSKVRPFVEHINRFRDDWPANAARATEDEYVVFAQDVLMAVAVYPEAADEDEDIVAAAYAAAGLLMMAADEAGPRKGGIEVATSDLTQLSLFFHHASPEHRAEFRKLMEQQRAPSERGCALVALAVLVHFIAAVLARVRWR